MVAAVRLQLDSKGHSQRRDNHLLCTYDHRARRMLALSERRVLEIRVIVACSIMKHVLAALSEVTRLD